MRLKYFKLDCRHFQDYRINYPWKYIQFYEHLFLFVWSAHIIYQALKNMYKNSNCGIKPFVLQASECSRNQIGMW